MTTATVGTDKSNARPAGEPQRNLDAIHTNVGFANTYRLELIKHTISISAAVFVFTLSFLKDYVGTRPIQLQHLMVAGWIALALSTAGGLVHMATWDRYYISYRDHWDNAVKGKMARKLINSCRYVAMVFQFGGLALGMVAIVAFYAANL